MINDVMFIAADFSGIFFVSVNLPGLYHTIPDRRDQDFSIQKKYRFVSVWFFRTKKGKLLNLFNVIVYSQLWAT